MEEKENTNNVTSNSVNGSNNTKTTKLKDQESVNILFTDVSEKKRILSKKSIKNQKQQNEINVSVYFFGF